MLKCSDKPKHIWTVYVFQCNQSQAAILSGQIYWPCFSLSFAAQVPHPWSLYLRNGSPLQAYHRVIEKLFLYSTPTSNDRPFTLSVKGFFIHHWPSALSHVLSFPHVWIVLRNNYQVQHVYSISGWVSTPTFVTTAGKSQRAWRGSSEFPLKALQS